MNEVWTFKIPSLINYSIMINKTRLKIIGILVFIVLTGLGAFIRIPLFFTPVPITLQTFFVLLSGACLGRKFGFFSQAGYVALGTAGVPIFAGASAGLGCLLGPTGGYLFGFVIVSFLIGTFLDKDKNFIQITGVFLIGSMLIDIFGSLFLMGVLRVSIDKAFLMGFLPFIGGDIAKSILAAVIYNRLKYKF